MIQTLQNYCGLVTLGDDHNPAFSGTSTSPVYTKRYKSPLKYGHLSVFVTVYPLICLHESCSAILERLTCMFCCRCRWHFVLQKAPVVQAMS